MKTIHRLTAFILVFISIICVPKDVYANPQNPVLSSGIKFINNTSDTDILYSFSLQWDKPASATGTSTDKNIIPEGYKIYYRNSTAGEAYRFNDDPPNGGSEVGLDNTTHAFNGLSLTGGSLYTFMITPYHTHEVVTYDANNVPTYSYPTIMPSQTNPPSPELLYLTDISVAGYGSQGDPDRGIPSSFTITWDNPTLGNTQVFDSYRIYYMLEDVTRRMDTNVYIDVNVADAKQINGGKQLEYTFNVANALIPGAFYAISVEPMIKGELFRGRASGVTSHLTLNGGTYVPAFTPMSREYRSVPNSISVTIPLYVHAIGGGLVEISWNTIITNNTLRSIEVQSCDDANFNPGKTLGKLEGSSSSLEITHWLTDVPSNIKYYRLLITYELTNGNFFSIPSNIVSYNPQFDNFLPYTPTITTFEGSGTPVVLDVTWEGFLREPYNATEKAAVDSNVGLYLDDYLDYYILITDSLTALELDGYPPYSIVAPINARDSLTALYNPQAKKYYYTQKFTTYYTLNSNGTLDTTPRTLEENKIYYIRIIAVRNNTGNYLRSNYSYASCFVPPSGDISVIPQMAAKPPFRVDNVTTNSVTLGWDRKWYEAYNAVDGNWYTVIGWNSDGEILFGDAASTSANPYNLYGAITDFSGSAAPLDTLKSILKQSIISTTSLSDTAITEIIGKTPFRYIDLTANAQYEIHVTTYEEMKKYGTYEDYLAALLLPTSTATWTATTPLDAGSDYVHPKFTITGLEQNTSYVVFFRPYYVINSTKLVACYPIFANATTLSIRDPLDIQPVIPLLEPNGQTDMSVTVKWEYSVELIYEISFSDTLAQYSAGGNPITSDEITANALRLDPAEQNGKNYLSYEIASLFPSTSYYVWIRSGNGTNFSEWSNPIMMNTLDIVTPDSPKGLGLASRDNIIAYNAENGLDLTRVSTDYMIIEWMKDFNDKSDNAASDGFPEVLLSPSFVNSCVARVSDLQPNKEYYIRIKTVLTVSRTGDGRAEKSYSYYVQVARDPYFEDIFGVGYVPALTVATPDPYNDRRKESDWCATLTIKTGKSNEEYDSSADDKTFPLPIQDYEVTFDTATGALNLRFRTNLTDSAGNHDNSVDQRFISNLIANQTQLYSLDLSTYNNRAVSVGSVELPYSIMKTFDDRKIPFRLKLGNITVDFMPGSLNTPEILNLKDYGMNASVKITLTQNPRSAPALSPGEGYACNPQNISVQVTSPSNTVTLGTLSNQMQVSINLNGNYSALESNVGAYYADANSGGWQRMDANYFSGSGGGTMSFKTTKPANYSAIARSLPIDTELSAQSDAAYNIMTSLDIRDMQTYKGSDYITANQLNNLIAAIAKGSKSLNINDSMSREDYESLGKSGYLITGTTVQRQVGINTLVRLYELKTKTAIKNYSDQRNSPYKDISLADQNYRDALLKAGDLGFFGSDADTNPHALLTIADALYMIDIIMGDAGM